MERNERANSLMGRIWYPHWAVGFDPTNPMPGLTTLWVTRSHLPHSHSPSTHPTGGGAREATRCRPPRQRCPSGGRRGWPTSATPTSALRWSGTASRSPSSPRPRPARRSISPSPSGRTASRRSQVSDLPLLHPMRSCPPSLIRFDAICLDVNVVRWDPRVCDLLLNKAEHGYRSRLI